MSADDKERRIPLRFLDVCFGDGVPDQTLTLWPADELTFNLNGDIVVEFRERSKEIVHMKGAHIRFYSVRDGFYTPRHEEQTVEAVET